MSRQRAKGIFRAGNLSTAQDQLPDSCTCKYSIMLNGYYGRGFRTGRKHTKGTQKTRRGTDVHNDVHDVIPGFWYRGERTRLNPRQD